MDEITPNITTDDPCEERAHELRRHLVERGIDCVVHWDRSPWGVRIPLTADRGELVTPSLYVLTEGLELLWTETRTGREVHGWVWIGALGGFNDEADQIFNDTLLRWTESPNLDMGVPEIADALVPLVKVLKNGATALPKYDG